LREVDDELRRDELIGFWKRFGRPLIGGIIALLAVWGGWLWWQNQQHEASGRDGESMAQAIDALGGGNTGSAQAKLKALEASKFDGYRATARIASAAMALQRGDNKGAIKTFGEVAADSSVAAPWRNLALVRQTAAEFDSMKPEAVIARLKPLAVPGNPWFGSAGEMVAISYLKTGKPDLAAKLFADIGKDEQVPESLRSRSIQMAGVLGVDAVPPAKEKQ
jgi:hypothetical protein